MPNIQFVTLDTVDQHKTIFTCPYETFVYTRKSFVLCSTPTTFQRCMISIFSKLIQSCMEVFMDDFIVYSSYFLKVCIILKFFLKVASKLTLCLIIKNIILWLKKVVLGHLIFERGIQVDKSKIDIITPLSYPSSLREVDSFLGHGGFYKRYIKDFSKIVLSLSNLLQKDVSFVCNEKCNKSFDELKNRHTSAPFWNHQIVRNLYV